MNNDFESNLLKRISFILTTKNRAPYLRKALENISQLIGPSDELIIIDGNSTDGTKEIIQNNLQLIDIFVSEPDESQAHAYNKGLLLSRGKYVCYLTDDDVFFQKAVEQAAGIMDNNPEIDVLIPGGTKEKNGKEWYVYMPKGSDFGKSVESLYANSWCGLGFFIRTSCIAKAGLSDSFCVAHDSSYIAQCINAGLNVKFARIKMFFHPIHELSGTISNKKLLKKITIEFVNKTVHIPFI
jgi:glycosyltransferase involved in cell wall biosynthesis